jgi:hypothetical protein
VGGVIEKVGRIEVASWQLHGSFLNMVGGVKLFNIYQTIGDK